MLRGQGHGLSHGLGMAASTVLFPHGKVDGLFAFWALDRLDTVDLTHAAVRARIIRDSGRKLVAIRAAVATTIGRRVAVKLNLAVTTLIKRPSRFLTDRVTIAARPCVEDVDDIGITNVAGGKATELKLVRWLGRV